MLLRIIKNQSFINILFSLIFLKKIDNKIIQFIKNYPLPPVNYCCSWSLKNQDIPFSLCKNNVYQLDINVNYSKGFVKSLLCEQFDSPYKELNLISIKNQDINVDEGIYDKIKNDLLSHLENSEYNKMKEDHFNLSFATGVNVGLVADYPVERNLFKILRKFFHKLSVLILNK